MSNAANQTQPRNSVVFVMNSLGKTAAGRTRSMLLRANTLAQAGYRVFIATWNLKKNYRSVFNTVCTSLDISGLEFLNLYEFFSECDLYGEGEGGAPLSDFSDEPQAVKLYRDSENRVLRRSLLDPTTQAPLKTTLYTPGHERPYLEFRYSPSGKILRIAWIRNGKTPLVFQNEKQLLAYWFSEIDRTVPGETLFISGQPKYDESLLQNPYAEKPLRVIAMMDTTIYCKPYTEGAPLNAQGRILERASEYEALVSPTRALADTIKKKAGLRENLVQIAPTSEPVTAPHRIKRKNRRRIALCCESRGAENIEDAVRAVALAAQSIDDISLDVYCSVKTMPKDLKTSSTTFQLKTFDRRDIPTDELSNYGLLLSTSRYGGLELSLLQARLAGIPIVSYDYLYGPREVIESGVTGFLVPPGNVEELAHAIVSILSNRGLQQKMHKTSLHDIARLTAPASEAALRSLVAKAFERARQPLPLAPLVPQRMSLFRAKGTGRYTLVASRSTAQRVVYDLKEAQAVQQQGGDKVSIVPLGDESTWTRGTAFKKTANEELVRFTLPVSSTDEQPSYALLQLHEEGATTQIPLRVRETDHLPQQEEGLV